jgi:NADH-quinone oxidoreductase subunit E
MLSEDEIREIQAEIPNYADKKAVCIDALKIVQHHRGGWVSDEALHDLAGFLEMSPDELDGVATFYNLIFREPVGKHIIMLCNSVTCYVMGYEKIRQYFKETYNLEFGQTTPDGNFTLLPAVCLGICDHAPAMMIDEDTYIDLDPEKIPSILSSYTLGARQ